MKKSIKSRKYALRSWASSILLIAAGLLSFEAAAQTLTPVQQYGQLKVVGSKIVDKNNQPISLAGNSLFWSNDGWGGEKYYNANVVGWLKNNWQAKIVRVAMGINESGGYLSNPAREKQKVKTVVDACLAAGLYVIIDWHSHQAEQQQQQAIAFFKEMATTYGNSPNVMYEVYNEPLQVSWSGVVKPYAEAVAGAIRAIDPDNLIIVGTPTWSQDVDVAASSPITRYTNIAYTLHFYAATHKASLRAKAQTALSKGVALFVTEYGTTEASGNGYVDAASTQEWMNFMKQNGISHLNWSVNDKAESASVLKLGTSPTSAWSDSYLTQSGTLVKGYIQNWNGTTTGGGPTTPPTPPTTGGTTVQAESYHAMAGVQTETTSDTGGGLNVGYLDNGDWMAYTIDVPTAGSYLIQYRVASLNGGGRISLEQNAGTTIRGTLAVPATGGWQTWTTISHTVTLAAGRQDIAIGVATGGYNLNWWSFTKATTGSRVAAPQTAVALYPNPTQSQLTVAVPETTNGARITVLNAQGREVLARNVSSASASQNVQLTVATLEPGVYSVQVISNGSVTTHRFVKQ
ncbi:cellulase family glycosylhydrolase [uncultured Hymenobacter sp.]|uniref:cellulase family glycosylhydrolase n=1 Tax=uncultured Hymenobacter sp. TaxID=170016 RepID=UPI0035CA8264